MPACARNSVIRQVIEQSGTGLLLDISHAQLAAHFQDTEFRDYLQGLPLASIREFHVTGVQYFGAEWIARLQAQAIPAAIVSRYAGKLIDHLPLTDKDWGILTWAAKQMRSGAWGCPWHATFEYGGVGSSWEALLDQQVLLEQLPKMHSLFHD